MVTSNFKENLQFLKEMYPNRVLLGIDEFCKITGLNIRTVYNWTAASHFVKPPIEFKKVGRRRMVSIPTLARFMSES